MGQDTAEPRRAVNMTLDAGLVRRARALTGNLSGTVETLLAGYVAAEERRRADLAAQMAQWAAASADVVARFGSPADEHDPF
jgi:post-segregation antitoxin (ccd killing protein)